MPVRLKLRTALLVVAALGLSCWAATRVAIWYVRRPYYRGLTSHHRIQAEALENRITWERYLNGYASDCLPIFLAHPEIDVRRATPGYLRSDTFHPFSGPRSGWAAAVEAHRSMIDRLREQAAYHARMSEGYRRADSYFWSAPPSGGAGEYIPWAPGANPVDHIPWWAR